MPSQNRAFARGRASLLATSMLATAVLASLGGAIGAVALSPGVALANGSCTPGPVTPGDPPTLAPTAGPALTCSGQGYTGIGFTDTTTNLTVTLANGSVGLNGVELSAAPSTKNLTFVVDTSAFQSGPINGTTAGQDGINLVSSGGNLLVQTGNTTSGTFPGAIVTGAVDGIFASTSSGGNSTVIAVANVTGLSQDGIEAASGSGNIVVTTGAANGGPVTVVGQGTGIAAITSGAGNVTVTTVGNVTGTTVNGIEARSQGGAMTVTTSNGTVTGAGSAILMVNTGGSANLTANAVSNGDVQLQLTGNTTFNAAINGNVIGDVTINNVSGVGCFTTALGATVTNNISVSGGGGNITGVTNGLVGGGVEVTNLGNGTVTYTANGNTSGISTSTVDGNDIVNANSNVNKAGFTGVAGNVTGNSTVVITLGNVSGTPFSVTDSNGNNGVYADQQNASGNQIATVNMTDPGNVTLTGALIEAVGVEANTHSSGVSSVATVNMTGAPGGAISVEGSAGSNWGVYALGNEGGSAFVTTNTGRTVSVGTLGGDSDIGVEARSFDTSGTQVASVVLGNSNTINVGNATSTEGVGVESVIFNGNATVAGGDGDSITVTGNVELTGVFADGGSGNATISFGNQTGGSTGVRVIDSATDHVSSDAIFIEADGNGTIAIGTTPVSTTNGTAIGALVGGVANITTAGNVSSANGVAIDIQTGSGARTINLDGANTVKGLGNATLPVIEVDQGVNATSTITIGALATVQANSDSPSATALRSASTDGSVVVTDNGTLTGEVNFGSLTDFPVAPSNSTVTVAGVWNTGGTSTFAQSQTTGSDLVTVASGGDLETIGATTFVFGNLSTNTFTNNGRVAVGGPTFALVSNTGHLISLNNGATGLIDLTSAIPGSTVMSGNSTTFTGTAGGEIVTTGDLSGPGSLADKLEVQTIGGTNFFSVFDSDSGPAAHVTTANPIILATATGTNSNTAFTLGSNSSGYHAFSPTAAGLIKGLWMYTLDNNVSVAGQQDTVLVSSPSPAAYELPIAATAAQTIWYATAPWLRIARPTCATRCSWPRARWRPLPPASGSRRWATGPTAPTRSIRRRASSSPSTTTRIPMRVWWPASTGLAMWARAPGSDRDRGGVFSNSTSCASAASTPLRSPTFEGWTASVYATYLQDQWFLDGQIKGDFLTLKASGMRRLGPRPASIPGAVRVEGGYRWAGGNGDLGAGGHPWPSLSDQYPATRTLAAPSPTGAMRTASQRRHRPALTRCRW